MAGQGGGLGDIETQDQFEERFWGKVEFPLDRLNECWLWASAVQSKGYGVIALKGSAKSALAHRVAHELVNGFLEDGEVVMHVCDTPRCVSPFHLKKGTQAANMWDMVKKGRQARGARRWNAKLTDEKVLEIRRMASEGMMQKEIAAVFGVSQGTVSGIVSNTHWKHVERMGS